MSDSMDWLKRRWGRRFLRRGQAEMVAVKRDYKLYKSLLTPSHHWAFNIILNTISLRLQDVWMSRMEGVMVTECFEDVQFLLVGSIGEGLALQSWQSQVPEYYNPLQTDVDTLAVQSFPVVDGPILSQLDFFLMCLHSDTSKTNPGYLRLVLQNTYFIKDDLIVQRGSTKYLTTKALMMRLAASFEENGPATRGTKSVPSFHTEMDYVRAFKCYRWPAKGWPSRRRPSGWPTQELIAKIVADGCHVVRKAHHTTSQSDIEIEFRYSFSVAEVELCKSLSAHQRQCMKLFKLIVRVASNNVCSEKYGLSSYHLKTVFLWLCEQLPASQWTEDSTGRCVLALLDKLLKCLSEANIPNYFIPENKMIDVLSDSAIKSLIGDIQKIRDNPLHAFFFSDICPFIRSMFYFGPREVFKPVFDTLDCEDLTLKYASYIHVLQNAARLVCRSSWQAAYSFVKRQSDLLELLGFHMRPSLLLTILLIDSGLLTRLSVNNTERFISVLHKSDFLSTLGYYNEATASLHGAETHISGLAESRDVQWMRGMLYDKLCSNNLLLGNFKEADKYSTLRLRSLPFHPSAISVLYNYPYEEKIRMYSLQRKYELLMRERPC